MLKATDRQGDVALSERIFNFDDLNIWKNTVFFAFFTS